MREQHRTDQVLAEFELMLGALAPAARTALTAAMLTLDQGARLYPRIAGACWEHRGTLTRRQNENRRGPRRPRAFRADRDGTLSPWLVVVLVLSPC